MDKKLLQDRTGRNYKVWMKRKLLGIDADLSLADGTANPGSGLLCLIQPRSKKKTYPAPSARSYEYDKGSEYRSETLEY